MEGSYGHIAIGEADKAHLRRAANWAKFIAIVQFIAIGFGNSISRKNERKFG